MPALKKLDEMLKERRPGVLNLQMPDVATYEDVSKILVGLLSSIREVKDTMSAENRSSLSQMERRLVTALEEIQTVSGEVGQSVNQAKQEMEKKIEYTKSLVLNEVSLLKKSIPTLPDLTYLEEKIDEVANMIPEKEEAEDDTPEEVRDLLESIEVEEEKLSIDAIRDLRKELEELKSRKNVNTTTFAVQRGQIKLYDLSDQLDGSTKTFTLPAFWRVLQVQASSFPNAFRPTTDYTTNAATPSITFTSEIDAATTLAAGQTVTVLYAEP